MSIHISYMSTKALRDHIGQLEAERKLVEPSRQWSVISALSVRIDNAKKELDSRPVKRKAESVQVPPQKKARAEEAKVAKETVRLRLGEAAVAFKEPTKVPLQGYARLAEAKESLAYKNNPAAVISNDAG